MSKVEIELNGAGIQALLKSDAVMKECESHARDILSRCGEGYELTTHVGKTRVNAQVRAATPHAYYSNLQHNTLLKAMGR